MTTPTGKACAQLISVFAEWEREMIGERTREGLAAKHAQGVRLGRPRVLPEPIRVKVAELRSDGMSFQAIADRFNEDEVPTARGGGIWYASTIRAVAEGGQ